MGQADFLELGSWNAQCFRCGRKRKASTMRKQWQGYWVCAEHWEPRHPQDFAKGIPDNPSVPWVQPLNWVWVGAGNIHTAIATEDLQYDLLTEDGLNNLIVEEGPPVPPPTAGTTLVTEDDAFDLVTEDDVNNLITEA